MVLEGAKWNLDTGEAEVLELRHNEKGEVKEQQLVIPFFEFSSNEDEVYAIDNDLILKKPQTFLNDRVMVFARISP